MLLEAPMIIIAVGVLSLFHPGVAFQGRWHEANFSWKKVAPEERNLKTVEPISTPDNMEMEELAVSNTAAAPRRE